MKPLTNPKHKLIAAGLALLAVPLLATQTASAASVARLLLGLAAIAGLGWWYFRGPRREKFSLPPRLNVIQRVGLSQRTGLALVEVDGRALLVVHGEGFARVQRLSRATSRRAATTRTAPQLVSTGVLS